MRPIKHHSFHSLRRHGCAKYEAISEVCNSSEEKEDAIKNIKLVFFTGKSIIIKPEIGTLIVW
jgi:hypothetical protein